MTGRAVFSGLAVTMSAADISFREGALNLGRRGQPTLDKNGGDNTFCPRMGGHEILSWNGGGVQENII